jgi:recombinational DNA repair protein RecT
MNHKKVIEHTLQKYAPTSVNMHKIENHFVMEIDYDVIVNAIVDELSKEGYTIIKGSSSVG